MNAFQRLFEKLSLSLDDCVQQLRSQLKSLDSALGSLGSLSKSASDLERLLPVCEKLPTEFQTLRQQVHDLSAELTKLSDQPKRSPPPPEPSSTSISAQGHPDSLRQLVLELNGKIDPLHRRIEALEAASRSVKPAQK